MPDLRSYRPCSWNMFWQSAKEQFLQPWFAPAKESLWEQGQTTKACQHSREESIQSMGNSPCRGKLHRPNRWLLWGRVPYWRKRTCLIQLPQNLQTAKHYRQLHLGQEPIVFTFVFMLRKSKKIRLCQLINASQESDASPALNTSPAPQQYNR